MHFRNTCDGKPAATCRATNCLGRRSVVHAECLGPVGAHVGMNPGDLVSQIALHDRQAALGADLIDRIRSFGVGAGDRVTTVPDATSELYYCLRGAGHSTFDCPLAADGPASGQAG